MPQKKMDDLWEEVAFEGYDCVDVKFDPDDPNKFQNDWDFPGTENETDEFPVIPHSFVDPSVTSEESHGEKNKIQFSPPESPTDHMATDAPIQQREMVKDITGQQRETTESVAPVPVVHDSPQQRETTEPVDPLQ